MKKFRGAALSVLILTGVLALTGCGKKEKKQITLTIKTPPISMNALNDVSVDETAEFLHKAGDAFAKQYEDADVDIDVQVFEYTKEDDAITGCFDADNAADVLYEGYFNMQTYIHTGRVVPLDDIISDSLRADIDERLWQAGEAGGKTYMMPYLSIQNILIYNKDMFRQCGLDKYIDEDAEHISSWTLEEWEEILDTLAQKLPDGKYPLMMYAKNEQGDTHIMTFIRSHGGNIFDESKRFNINTEEGTAGLKWLQEGCERGWYPPQCENLEISDNTELFRNKQLAIVLSNNASFNNYDKGFFGCVNFPDITGNGITTSFVTGFEVFDNGDEDKLKAAKEFVKFVSENNEWAEYSSGGIPARNSIAEKYMDRIFLLKENMANNKNLVDITCNNPNWRGVRSVFYTHIQSLLAGTASPEEAAAAIDKDCNEAIEKGYAESILHE